MKYYECRFHFCNYPYWRCRNEKSPYFMVNPYDVFREFDARGIEGEARATEFISRRKRCPCSGAWTGKGENPCEYAKWEKENVKVKVYNGYPMTLGETEFLHGLLKSQAYEPWEMLAFYRSRMHDVDWNAVMRLVKRGTSWIYDGDYDPIDGDIVYDRPTKNQHLVDTNDYKELSFLEREYGLYHVLMFVKKTIPKRAWKHITKMIDTDEFRHRVKQYESYHVCGLCGHDFVSENVVVVRCPSCGYGGY